MAGQELRKIVTWQEGFSDRGFGTRIEFEGPGWGVERYEIFPESERSILEMGLDVVSKHRLNYINWVVLMVKAARKQRTSQMVGVPIEATFEKGMLKSWRILEEVL